MPSHDAIHFERERERENVCPTLFLVWTVLYILLTCLAFFGPTCDDDGERWIQVCRPRTYRRKVLLYVHVIQRSARPRRAFLQSFSVLVSQARSWESPAKPGRRLLAVWAGHEAHMCKLRGGRTTPPIQFPCFGAALADPTESSPHRSMNPLSATCRTTDIAVSIHNRPERKGGYDDETMFTWWCVLFAHSPWSRHHDASTPPFINLSSDSYERKKKRKDMVSE